MCAAALPSNAGSNTDLVRQLNRAFVDVARTVSPSVVVITATQRPVFMDTDVGSEPRESDPLDFWRRFNRQFDEEPFQGQGSGVIIRKDGYILTNRHVVEDADRIDVRLLDGRTFRARLQGVDRQSDVAVIKIDADDLPVARFGDSSKVQVGEFAIAIGAPFNLEYSVTFGHISATSRGNIIPSFMGGHTMDQDFIQTDANINPGNSGGPLVNIDGEVIGINTLIRGLRSGIGFAIPSNLAREIAEKLIAEGRFRRVWLGLEIHALRDDPDYRALLEGIDSGVVIKSILRNGPSAKSDLRPGDVIRSVEGTRVATPQELRSAIRSKSAGKPLRLDVFRDGKNLAVTVEPAEYPEPAAEPRASGAPGKESASPNFGIKVQTLDSETAAQFGLTARAGVVVTAVEPRSPAANRRIRRGDVIVAVSRQPVANEQEFTNALARAGAGPVFIELISDGNPTFEVLKRSDE